jgi:hypothetical protein
VAVAGTMRFQCSRSIVIPMVDVMGTLFILSYGETIISLNAPHTSWSKLNDKR